MKKLCTIFHSLSATATPGHVATVWVWGKRIILFLISKHALTGPFQRAIHESPPPPMQGGQKSCFFVILPWWRVFRLSALTVSIKKAAEKQSLYKIAMGEDTFAVMCARFLEKLGLQEHFWDRKYRFWRYKNRSSLPKKVEEHLWSVLFPWKSSSNVTDGLHFSHTDELMLDTPLPTKNSVKEDVLSSATVRTSMPFGFRWFARVWMIKIHYIRRSF